MRVNFRDPDFWFFVIFHFYEYAVMRQLSVGRRRYDLAMPRDN